jgi:hypothetical protein
MNRSVRGMAKVSVLWTIVVMVAFLVALMMFFLTSGELETQVAQKNSLQKQVDELTASTKKNSEDIVTISNVFGFQESGARANAQLATDGLKTLREGIPDVGSEVKTYQAALPVVVQAYSNQKARAAEFEAQVASKNSEIETLQSSIRELGDKNATEAQELRRQAQDAETRLGDLKTDLERQLAEAREQIKDRDSKWRAAERTIEENNRQFAAESEAMRGRMAEMGRKLNPFVKEPNAADGKVLSVSANLMLGWIDVGAPDRLPVGTRFAVRSGGKGSDRLKAMCEVTKVEGGMAEVLFMDQTDPFDPPTVGDTLVNPLYDPRGDRACLMVGSFSGRYAKDKVEGLLAGMGVKVQRSLDQYTDFVIVGSEMYTDAEGQPLDTPANPADAPEVKAAIAQGCQVVLLKDLRNYFRF